MNPSTHASVLDEIKDPALRAAAWARFQARYQPTIHRWCVARGLQPADADDLTQVVLLKLLHVLPGYEHDPDRGRFRSWLKTVVTTTVIDFVRSRENRPADRPGGGTECYQQLAALRDPNAGDDLTTSIGTDAASDPDLKQVVARVRAVVDPKTWQAFELLTVGERDAKTVAQELGMSIGAVYQAKYRVRELANREYATLISSPNAARAEDRP